MPLIHSAVPPAMRNEYKGNEQQYHRMPAEYAGDIASATTRRQQHISGTSSNITGCRQNTQATQHLRRLAVSDKPSERLAMP